MKSSASEKWNSIKSTVSEKASDIKTNLSSAWNTMKEATTNAFSDMKSKIQENGGGIKGVLKTFGETYVSLWKGAFDSIDSATGGKLSSALSTVKDKLSAIKDAFVDKLGAAKDFVYNIIDRIKGLFDFDWSLPHLKLPHFYISGSFSLNPPSVPHLSIDWYKKAYDNPVMFTQPTVLATTGGYKGFGDGAGAEIVLGMNKLRELVGRTGNITNNITIIQQPGESTEELADRVANIIYREAEQRRLIGA